MKTSLKRSAMLAVASVGAIGILYACATKGATTQSLVSGDAASRVYVAPGSYDEFYTFMSGGYSGQVSVYGLPSGRLLKLIPVFSQFPEDGYGYNEETKPMLQTTYGFLPWDDSHHPELSQTDGVPDGRWLFINANNTPRIARIDLTRFETDEIIHCIDLVNEPSQAVARRLGARKDREVDLFGKPADIWVTSRAAWAARN